MSEHARAPAVGNGGGRPHRDAGMTGGGWIELPVGAYKVVAADAKQSHCQLEVDVAYNRLRSYSLDEKSDVAPLRVLSFDIECAGRKGASADGRDSGADCRARRQLPRPQARPRHHDCVLRDAPRYSACLSLGPVLISHAGESTPFIRNLFTLGGCSNIIGAEVFSYRTEAEMLSAWRAFMIQCVPLFCCATLTDRLLAGPIPTC